MKENVYQKAFNYLKERFGETEEVAVRRCFKVIQELVDFTIPMKPRKILDEEAEEPKEEYICPLCENWVEWGYEYCRCCRQKLDWSEEDE